MWMSSLRAPSAPPAFESQFARRGYARVFRRLYSCRDVSCCGRSTARLRRINDLPYILPVLTGCPGTGKLPLVHATLRRLGTH